MPDKHHADRRRFLRTSAIAGTALIAGTSTAIAQQIADTDASHRPLNKGDIAILRFLAAAEILETDLWQQYNELGGIQDSEVPGGSGNAAYTAALKNLDGDMDQYIHDNTEDEFTHQNFINAYLMSNRSEAHVAVPNAATIGARRRRSDREMNRGCAYA